MKKTIENYTVLVYDNYINNFIKIDKVIHG